MLPIDRTNLTAAQTNQVPNALIRSALNIAAIQTPYDTIDELYNYTSGLVAGGVLQPYPAFLSRQALINGNFDIAQRGTSFTNPLNNAYTLDRYSLISGITGTLPTSIIHSQQQLVSGDIPNAYYFYRINPNGAGSGFGANDVYGILQKIENGARYLAGLGKKVTLSFWARSSIAGKKLGIYTQQIYGTGGSPSAGESITGNNFTLTSTWTKYKVTLSTNTLVGKVFGTNNDDFLSIGIVPMWGAGVYGSLVGSTGVAETFGGSGNIDIAQIQVNAGDVVVPFQPRSFAEELQLCQRYYEKSYAYGDLPGTANYPVQLVLMAGNALAASTSGNVGSSSNLIFKVRKRISPTVTLYSFDGTANAVQTYPSNSKRIGITSVSVIKDTGVFQFITFDNTSTTAISAGDQISASYTADAEL